MFIDFFLEFIGFFHVRERKQCLATDVYNNDFDIFGYKNGSVASVERRMCVCLLSLFLSVDIHFYL